MSAPDETTRTEAFSDGVFAIAITLLVLELKVPQGPDGAGSLAKALLREWPGYLGYFISFLTIGVMWINHHRLFGLIRRCDDVLLALNVLLMLGVSFVPFPTAVLADHLLDAGARTAAAFYSGTFLALSFVFQALWRWAAHGRRLLGAGVTAHDVRRIDRQYAFGPLLYGLAFVVAPFSAATSVAVNMGLAVLFALPPSVFARGAR